tara:strand:- start:1922 stop:2407 length:486 start_codon:yes stop_codon:yes gene_type:complete
MNKIKYLLAIIVFELVLCATTAKADKALSHEERIVALTILGEARGEGEKGMYAVACVIQKRATERKLTTAQVCRQPYQFSIWNAGKNKVKKEDELYYLWKSKSTPYARKIAKIVCNNLPMRDITKGANHFHSTKMKKPPYWAKGRKPTAIIGNHAFYNLND